MPVKSVKESLRSGSKPFQEVALRYSERIQSAPVQLFTNEKSIQLSGQHQDDDEYIPGVYFTTINIGDVVFQCGVKDSCFSTFSRDIVILKTLLITM